MCGRFLPGNSQRNFLTDQDIQLVQVSEHRLNSMPGVSSLRTLPPTITHLLRASASRSSATPSNRSGDGLRQRDPRPHWGMRELSLKQCPNCTSDQCHLPCQLALGRCCHRFLPFEPDIGRFTYSALLPVTNREDIALLFWSWVVNCLQVSSAPLEGGQPTHRCCFHQEKYTTQHFYYRPVKPPASRESYRD